MLMAKAPKNIYKGTKKFKKEKKKEKKAKYYFEHPEGWCHYCFD